MKFEPILQPKIWGGDLLHRYLNKDKKSENIGESWEISDVEDFHSIISNGDARGMSLNQLIEQKGDLILGKKNLESYAKNFPLLIKFLDAQIPLSIQVHPDDHWAEKLENGRGKTEMWYILHADNDAEIYLGWEKDMTQDEVEYALKNSEVQNYMQKFTPQKGDVFYVPSRTVHSIGKGVVLAEIQQTSDITYRLYDYDRLENGKPRDLHLEKGLKVMNFNYIPNLKRSYNPVDNELVQVVNEKYFSMNFLSLKSKMNFKTEDSFQIYIGVEGTAYFEVYGETTSLQKGETLLIPAGLKNFTMSADQAEILQIKVN